MIPSSLSQARRDQRLYPVAVVAYQFCLEFLDTEEWRPLKIEVVARECRLRKMTAVDALRALHEAGYIARGPRPKGEPRQYRLLPAPRLEYKSRAA